MTVRKDDYSGRRIRSVTIAFNIIEVLQERNHVGVTELADELDHSKSTIYSHLQTLRERSILVQEDNGYRLSLRLLDMANSVREQIGNYDVISSEVDKLAEETGEIAQFGIEEHGRTSYLYKATGEQAVETRSRVGIQQPMYSTSLGKTILAFMPSSRTEEIVESIEYTSFTSQTVTGPQELYAELDVIAKRGYGIDDEENIEGLRCVAAPVKREDTVLGAISITGPSSRFTDERIEELSEHVKRAANVIELNTKFS
ncbi:IclR family transcriptional regulator [Halocatena pleomorpha]|uniref:IclR family transcriptional regulator n=1 Tax=Halocatena pleomorpha TaxID=1785090 RepID=A0A3P3R9E9_9EURY|nr:IclR family transcriptional regulator [Halocatena pleomorpha]RRJ30101.1 IclR family transcriptional regulator [Halocatena pleomorpha]